MSDDTGPESGGPSWSSLPPPPPPAVGSAFPGVASRGPAFDHASVAGAATSRRPRRGVFAGAGVGLVVVVLVIAGLTVLGAKSAQAAVIDSINSTLADHSADVSVTLAGSADGTSFQSTGSGAIDFTDNAMQMQVNVTGEAQAQSVDLEYLGETLYEEVPGIADLVPGKSWVSLDLAGVAGAGASAGGPGSLGSTSNPIAMLHLLSQHGGTVVGTGSSTIDGVAVQGYSVTFSRSALAQDLNQANLPQWMRQAVTNVNFQSLNCDVYVDGAGLLRRVSIAMGLQVASATTVSVNESLDFSNYGAPVSIVAPPSNQVVGYQQFLQAAEGRAGA